MEKNNAKEEKIKFLKSYFYFYFFSATTRFFCSLILKTKEVLSGLYGLKTLLFLQ